MRVLFIRLLRFEGSFEETIPAKNLEQTLAQVKGLIKEATCVLCPGDGQVQAAIATPHYLYTLTVLRHAIPKQSFYITSA